MKLLCTSSFRDTLRSFLLLLQRSLSSSLHQGHTADFDFAFSINRISDLPDGSRSIHFHKRILIIFPIRIFSYNNIIISQNLNRKKSLHQAEQLLTWRRSNSATRWMYGSHFVHAILRQIWQSCSRSFAIFFLISLSSAYFFKRVHLSIDDKAFPNPPESDLGSNKKSVELLDGTA